MSIDDAPNRGNGRESDSLATNDVVEAVRTLIGLMGRGGIRELDLSFGDVSIRLRGQGTSVNPAPSSPLPALETSLPMSESHPLDSLITAPMIGTFYAAPSPADPPFVGVGERVEVGQVVGIIEAMKIMNEIVADRSGVIAEVLVSNGEAVEYGSPLFRVSLEDTLLG